VVRLDGQPLAGAHITFAPVQEPQGQRQSGPEAGGDTDDNGYYALKTVFGDPGASVGKNRVMISTRRTQADSANPDRFVETARERVPTKYFSEQAPLFFDVPAAGTKSADFDLVSH
jgi:hypothetical protein